MNNQRPPRAELFGYYYLGITPLGTYQFPNAHQVANHYKVSVDAVLSWLEEYGLDSATVGKRAIELSRHGVDLQMEFGNLTPDVIRDRIEEVLQQFDRARTGRQPWVDGPIK